ncbi:MAG: RraA family protein [Propionibacteriaceae bacterium]|nr:RraA family protein [Propionibacteriaceae bacterium]
MTTSDLIARLGALSTSGVSDALDKLAIPGQALGIKPVDRDFRLVGRAWTLHYGPIGQVRGTVGDYIDDLGPDDVVVLDNQGRLDATVWGDLLTVTASHRGVAGTVIDGVCRDIGRSLSLGYPIFSRGNYMRTGKDRVQVEATQVPVSIGGIRVEPGDYLLGDGDGLVIVPASQIEAVLEAAESIEQAEDRIREYVEQGMPLVEARRQVGYHDLQHHVSSDGPEAK